MKLKVCECPPRLGCSDAGDRGADGAGVDPPLPTGNGSCSWRSPPIALVRPAPRAVSTTSPDPSGYRWAWCGTGRRSSPLQATPFRQSTHPGSAATVSPAETWLPPACQERSATLWTEVAITMLILPIRLGIFYVTFLNESFLTVRMRHNRYWLADKVQNPIGGVR